MSFCPPAGPSLSWLLLISLARSEVVATEECVPGMEEMLVEPLLGSLWLGCFLVVVAHQGFELGAELVEAVEAPGSVWEEQADLT